MLDLITKGGPLIWLILGCSFLSLGVFVERFFAYHRAVINVGDFLHGLSSLVRKKNYAEALHECAGTPGPVARVIHSALIRHESPRSELKDIVREAGQMEVPRLERYLPAMLTIAYVTPLIGLLGTVIGMVDTFMAVSSASGFATQADISKGVYQSLITSAAGLAVAIPSYVLYGYLAGAARTLMHDMERGGIEIVNIICDSREVGERDILEFRKAEEAKVKGRKGDGGEKGVGATKVSGKP
ncbi:MAG: MotA/TolQ/ExbB proton channel family protein [Verrucomicrobiales bacterium]|nr:MotA/TolQ/ExbB proton channel family protein [Verrucomicrobiales bacterium]